jgi:hypothetical protein
MCDTTKGVVRTILDKDPHIECCSAWATRGTKWLNKHKATMFAYQGRRDVLVYVPEIDDLMELGDLLPLNIETSRMWQEKIRKVLEDDNG